jgi:hypothetical protein
MISLRRSRIGSRSLNVLGIAVVKRIQMTRDLHDIAASGVFPPLDCSSPWQASCPANGSGWYDRRCSMSNKAIRPLRPCCLAGHRQLQNWPTRPTAQRIAIFHSCCSPNSTASQNTEGRIAALKSGSKCSFTPCKLRFFARFCLALHPLIAL